MQMKVQLMDCPNCGGQIAYPLGQVRVSCKHCREVVFAKSSDDVKNRQCNGKLGYDSRREALQAARESGEMYGTAMIAYKCQFCRQWHIGNDTKPPRSEPPSIDTAELTVEDAKLRLYRNGQRQSILGLRLSQHISNAERQTILAELEALKVEGAALKAWLAERRLSARFLPTVTDEMTSPAAVQELKGRWKQQMKNWSLDDLLACFFAAAREMQRRLLNPSLIHNDESATEEEKSN